MTQKQFFLFATALLLCLFIFYVLKNESGSLESATPTSSSVRQSDTQLASLDLPYEYRKLAKRFEELEQQQQNMREQIQQLRQKLNRSPNATSSQQSGNNQDNTAIHNFDKDSQMDTNTGQSQTQSNPEVNLEDTQEVALAQQNAQREFRQHMENLNISLSQQEEDPGWSESAKQQIDNTLISDTFDGSEIITSDCRSTLCAVEVRHDSTTSMETFMNQFTRKLGWNESSGQYDVIEQDGQYITRMYISRSGHALPSE